MNATTLAMSTVELPHPALSLPKRPLNPLQGTSANDRAKVTLKLFGRSDMDLLNLARAHYDAIAKSDFYTQPSPSQEVLDAEIEGFEADCMEVIRLRTELRAAMARRKTGRRSMESMLNRRGAYVQSASNGNAQKIRSAGMGVQRPRSKVVGPLPAPTDVCVVPGVSAGEVILTWGRVPHALTYRLEYGPEGGALESLSLAGRRKRVLNLPVRVEVPYVFRIAATGSPGSSNFSAPVKCFVR